MKRVFSIIGILALLCAVYGCSARQTDITEADAPQVKSLINSAILNEERDGYDHEPGDVFGEAHHVFACYEGNLSGKDRSECMTVYLYYVCGYYTADGEQRGGSAVPAAIVLNRAGDTWTLEQIWHPREGDDYNKDLKATFPSAVYKELCTYEENHNENIKVLEQQIIRNTKN
ncbi:MAG: hypothetical protein IKE65_05305 [Clostridia bacterium]|nr:hypothetical protein [Clostridia bacterium]